MNRTSGLINFSINTGSLFSETDRFVGDLPVAEERPELGRFSPVDDACHVGLGRVILLEREAMAVAHRLTTLQFAGVFSHPHEHAFIH